MPSGPSAKAFSSAAYPPCVAVVLEASGVDASDAGEQAQLRAARVQRLGRGEGARSRAAVRRGPHARKGVGRRRGDRVILRPLAGRLHERRRRPLAEPEARRGLHGSVGQARAELGEELRPPARRQAMSSQTCTIVSGCRRDREHRVERGDAPGLGGRHGEPLADVVERARRDPAFARLGRPEGREQQVPLRPDRVAAGRDVALEVHPPSSAFPSRGRRAEDGVHGRALRGRGFRARDQVQIHGPTLASGRRRPQGLTSLRAFSRAWSRSFCCSTTSW